MDAPFTPNTFYKFAPAETLTTYKDSYGHTDYTLIPTGKVVDYPPPKFHPGLLQFMNTAKIALEGNKKQTQK